MSHKSGKRNSNLSIFLSRCNFKLGLFYSKYFINPCVSVSRGLPQPCSF